MAISGWLVLVAICLIYVAIGLWAISKIFPGDRATTRNSEQMDQERVGLRR
ncbi:MAG: hypothetical protein ABI899_08130 [Actinomycetota bacterium]